MPRPERPERPDQRESVPDQVDGGEAGRRSRSGPSPSAPDASPAQPRAKPRLSRRAAALSTIAHVAALPNDCRLLRKLLKEFIREKEAGWGRQCSWRASVPTVDAVALIDRDPVVLKLAINEILGVRQAQRRFKASKSEREAAPPRKKRGLVESRLERLGPGRHSDGRGHGLQLLVEKCHGRRWVQRVTVAGARIDLGLGPWPAVSLDAAREAAAAHIAMIRQGLNPKHERARKNTCPTFREVAEDFVARNETSWKRRSTAQAYRSTFERYVFPAIGKTPVDQITVRQIADLAIPHWRGHGSIGYRILQKCTTIMDDVVAQQQRPDNPARAARKLMPKVRKIKQHYPSVPYACCPAALQQIRDYGRRSERTNNRLAALALEFVVLTAVRTNEACEAVWPEFDLERRVWTIPGERMKESLKQEIPLSDQALDVLRRVRDLQGGDDPHVFGYPEHGKQRLLPESKLSELARKLKLGGSPHGFRSSFRVWAGEVGEMPRELAELSLSHTEAGDTELAYRRTVFTELRRPFMQAWADYLLPRNPPEE